MHALVLANLPLLYSSSSDGSGTGWLLLLGPVCGSALYAAVYRYYRNADKTDTFERETRIVLKDQITGQEQKIDQLKGTRQAHVDGDNSKTFRARVGKLE
jgi:hypothetical protein